MTNRFDHHFRLYAGIYFEGLVDWPWFKAQAIVESGLDPQAVSPAGAMGLMQLMPKTAEEISRRLWVENRPFDPRRNILFGIHHMHDMWMIWKKEKGLERLRFSLAAYNAGPGNIIKAQKLALTKDKWHSLALVLPQVTGQKNARQTIGYVEKIERERKKMLPD